VTQLKLETFWYQWFIIQITQSMYYHCSVQWILKCIFLGTNSKPHSWNRLTIFRQSVVHPKSTISHNSIISQGWLENKSPTKSCTLEKSRSYLKVAHHLAFASKSKDQNYNFEHNWNSIYLSCSRGWIL